MNKLLLLIIIAVTVPAKAGDWKGTFGKDAGSFGGVLVHDFAAQATVSGIEWDALHVQYRGDQPSASGSQWLEVGELGAFAGKRDTDSHAILGPSLGTPMGSLATAAANAQELVDWPFLQTIRDYGQYAHAYVNIGWDFTNLAKAHGHPDLIGFGGVLKFGKTQ